MVSIIIPASNEGKTIERLLRSILQDAQPQEFEIIVVCNGCRDDTASRARQFADRGVIVLESDVASKSNALNLGDKSARYFPRFYIDADIEISTAAVRDVVKMLQERPDILLASPRPIVEYGDRNWILRAYFRIWTKLPYFTEAMIGSGVFAFSEKGRSRFEEFPDIIADDEFARLQVEPHERGKAASTFSITPPATLSGLLKVNTRVRAGNYELRQKFPQLASKNTNANPRRSLLCILSTPTMWLDAPIYLGIMLYAKLAAHRKLRNRQEKVWERDDSGRSMVGPST